MEFEPGAEQWEKLSKEEKRRQLYLKQKALLELFLEKGAISRAQYEKSLNDLTEKMGYGAAASGSGGRHPETPDP